MKIIVVSDRGDRTHSFHLNKLARFGGTALLLSLLVAVSFSSYKLYGLSVEDDFNEQANQSWSQRLDRQRDDIAEVQQQAERDLSALTLQIADIQSRMVRIDALGQRVAEAAKLEKGEFDFSRKPPIGGPPIDGDADGAGTISYQPPAFMDLINQLNAELNDRERQLTIINDIMINREQSNEAYLSGRPIKKGWLSSPYGRRTDPFNGHIAMHNGVDFAGDEGSEVIAVASGVVTFEGRMSGYGNMVELTHGDGYKTRYAHNASHLVQLGDVVKKGDPITLMGSTGRSTGPHVHFEVLRNDVKVDPSRYIYRASR
jgi:murein DD-endopeptidase MepM/ murein hydrolase activator NlpD